MRTITKRTMTALAALGVVILGGCEGLPSTPEAGGGLDSAGVSPDLAAAVDASWELLPSAEELQLLALEAFATGPADAAVEAHILEAGELDVAARSAAEGGDPVAADTYRAWSEDASLEAALTQLGPGFSEHLVGAVETALSRIDEAAKGDTPPVRARLDRARMKVRDARSALDRSDLPAAVRSGFEAADELRGLDPEARARQIVGNAVRILERAKALAGPNPRPEIAEILRRAQDHCDAARRALANGNWALSVREARLCATHARRVILLLSGGVSDDTLAERAQAMVDDAGSLLARAVELAGDDPEPTVGRALDRAREYLQEAQRSLENEEWREAIRLARESAAISRRVIGHLSGSDRPDGLQERAEQAVAHAQELLMRVDALVGDDPRPQIQSLLARARTLIGEADAALRAEDWRLAVFKAREAAVVLQRVIRLVEAVPRS